MQKDSIHSLEDNYDETSKIRHDMKNYISSSLSMAEQGDNKELINYVQNISEEKINKINNYISLKRKVLSAVINSKLGTAEQKGFHMECVILNEIDNIANIDAGILLANLLDNALEACEKNKGKSEIMIKIWSEAGYYCIEISNTVEKDVLFDHPHLLTRKKDKNLHNL